MPATPDDEPEETRVLRLDDEVERRAAVAELLGLLSAGLTDEQARYEMGIGFAEYDQLKAALYEQEEARLGVSSAKRVFVDFAIAQRACLADVDALLLKIEDSKQFSAAVGAIRLASEIHEKIIKMGQDLGVLAKRAEERRVLVAMGTIEEMRASVAKEIRAVDEMMRRAGSADILALEAGPTHRAAPVAPVSTTGKATLYKGRRVVKEGLSPT